MITKLPFSEDFAKAWEEWLQFRKDIKKPYKSDKSIQLQLDKFMLYSEDTAIKMIEQSIRNQYQGIFPLKAEDGKVIEEKQTYKPEALKVNGSIPTTYKSKPFNRNEYREHVKLQLEANYKYGTEVKDYGNIMHQKLTDLGILDLKEEKRKEIRDFWEHEFTRKRTRFDEPLLGSLESEIKTSELKIFLEECRDKGRYILKEI